MRRIFTIFRRDLLSISRDAMLLYITIAPILIALVMRFILPGVNETTVNLVITQADQPNLSQVLEPYFNIEIVQDQAALHRRVLAYDDTIGVQSNPGQGYTVILEGNESHDSQVLPGLVLSSLDNRASSPPAQFVDLNEYSLPLREWVAAFTALTVLFLSSVIMGFHIIEDKETRMMMALGVTPLKRWVYVLSRSLVAVLLALVSVLGSVWVLGLNAFDPLKVLAVTLCGALAATMFGLALGAISSNQIAGIANLKFGFLIVLAPAILTFMIPEKYWPALYWAPPFWVFRGYHAVFVQSAGWEHVWPLLAWTLVVSALFLLAVYPFLRRRLDFARF